EDSRRADERQAELRRPRSDRSCDDAVILTRDRSHAVLVELIHDRHSLGRASACVADQQLKRAPQPIDVGNSKLESSLEMAPGRDSGITPPTRIAGSLAAITSPSLDERCVTTLMARSGLASRVA